MSLTLKAGVSLKGLQPMMALAAEIIAGVYADAGFQFCVITSANDGVHMDGSLHYQGRALDFRTHDLRTKGENPDNIRLWISAALGSEFDVLLEDSGTPNEHIHVEWDPK